jgi:hypothetical protein
MKPDFDAARTVLGEGPGQARRAQQRAELLRRASVPAGRRLRWLAVPVLAGLASLLLFWARAGDAVEAGAVLTAVDGARALRFAQGTVVALAEGSSARVDELDERHVEFVLVEGRLDAQVTKGTGRTWRYHAGPWVVRVVGTKLNVTWSPSSGRFEVEVTEGAVEVSRDGQAPVLVRAGERLERTPAALVPLAPTPFPAPTPPAPVSAPPTGSPVAVGPVPVPVRPSRVASPPPPVPSPPPPAPATPRWRELLAQGQRGPAIDEAQRAGLVDRPELASDDDALALADAARLERRVDVARALLRAVLARGGRDAAEAAFLLGRLAADAQDPATARTFFERSLVLSATGPFSEQARGRLLEALLELQALDEARRVAREYLGLHPSGAWAALARKLAEGR